MSAKAESIGHGHIDFAIFRAFRRVVKVTFRIRSLKVQCLMDFVIHDREYADDSFDRTGSAQKMAGHGLGGVHNDVIGMLTEDFLDRLGLILIIETVEVPCALM